MNKITSSIKQLWSNFRDKEYRDGFLEETIADTLAVQIQRMRQSRGWTQAELAARTDTKQAGVCRWENSAPPASLTTLRKIAAAFDVALVVKFVPFSQILLGDGDAVDKEIAPFNQDVLFPERKPMQFIFSTEDKLVINTYKIETEPAFVNEKFDSGNFISSMVH